MDTIWLFDRPYRATVRTACGSGRLIVIQPHRRYPRPTARYLQAVLTVIRTEFGLYLEQSTNSGGVYEVLSRYRESGRDSQGGSSRTGGWCDNESNIDFKRRKRRFQTAHRRDL